MNQAAVITGAAGALGRAIARRLTLDFDVLVLADLPSSHLDEAAKDLSGHAVAVGCDLTSREAPAKLSDALHELDAEVGGLVNNAGINRDGRVKDLTEDQFRSVIAVDLIAPLRLTEALRPHMSSRASVVNIASRAALGNFGQANYVAAKSGLATATRAMALNWAPTVRVNTVAPGLVDTPMTAGMPPEVLSKLVARVPAGRMADPAEIAELVAFCVSAASSYLTGQLLIGCGGRSLAA